VFDIPRVNWHYQSDSYATVNQEATSHYYPLAQQRVVVWAVSLGGSNADATARIHQAKTLVPTLFSTSTERVKASEVLTLVPPGRALPPADGTSFSGYVALHLTVWALF
jgi:hypothetical protein